MKARILHRDVSAGNLFSYGHESPASGGQPERHNVSNDWGLSILLDARRQQQFERTVRCLFNLLAFGPHSYPRGRGNSCLHEHRVDRLLLRVSQMTWNPFSM